MYPLPSELITIISSYINSSEDLNEFEYLFRFQIDWITLVILNYPQFYHVNIRDYRVKFIYYELLNYDNDLWDNFLPIYKDTIKYIVLNKLNKSKIFRSNPIGDTIIIRLDDIDIFNSIKYREEDITDCMLYNSTKILSLLISHFNDSSILYHNLWRAIYNDDFNTIKINTFTMVTQRIDFSKLNALDALTLLRFDISKKYFFDHLLNQFSSDLGVSILEMRDKLRSQFEFQFHRISLYYFEQFYNKFNMIFTKDYMLVFIKYLNDNHRRCDGTIHSSIQELIYFLQSKL